ncbi:hypothetical protein [Kitasatospora sp. McL0602]|uniref:hypothetical protein n=1 Tax=Kitasatospora sp. McL0602 TaxID=3439530 RepID=UPI003F89B802
MEPAVGAGAEPGVGGVVPSLIEALEAREAEVRGRADRLREQIAGLSEELSRLEVQLSRLRVTRGTVDEVLADGPSSSPGGQVAGDGDGDGDGDGSGGVAAALLVAEAELDVTAMSPEYQAVIGLFATTGAAMRCKEVRAVGGRVRGASCGRDACEVEASGRARDPGRDRAGAVQGGRAEAGMVSAAHDAPRPPRHH